MQRLTSFVILAFALLVIVQAKPWCSGWSCSQQWQEGGSDYDDGGNDYDGGNQGGYGGNGGGSQGGHGGGNGGGSDCDGGNCGYKYAINRLGTGHHNTNNVHMYKHN